MNLEELLKSKERTLPLPKYVKGEERFLNGVDLNNNETDFIDGNISVKTGQFFLYEKIEDDLLHYPKLGIFLNDLPCDQTIELEWFDVRRSWEYRQTYTATSVSGTEYKAHPYDLQSQIQRLILWHDSIDVYGVWDKMPTWKELRVAYEKTIWFGMSIEEKRDRKIRSIL